MSPDRLLLTHPRTTGEILDDACRIAFAEYPLLLVLSGLFLVPFFGVLLLLLAMPRPEHLGARCLMAGGAALLAATTGIGSGACQEVFRCLAEGKATPLSTCLLAALRRGLDHATARAMLLPAVLLGLGCMLLPGLSIWMASSGAHILIAEGRGRRAAHVKELGRAARFNPAKAFIVVVSRVPLLAVAVMNLHLLSAMALWIAGNLVGFDVGLVSFTMTLGNPVYLVALTMLAWLLLAPNFEASNFLLHLDTLTRQEGLDLFYRVRQSFPMAEARRAGVLLAIVSGLMFAAPVAAADPASAARTEIGHVADEMKNADPFPGSDRWLGRLTSAADRLEMEGGVSRFAWFRRRLHEFGKLDRGGALDVLTDLDRRLARFEGLTGALSKGELKGLLRPARNEDEEPESTLKKTEPKRREREEPPEVRRDVDAPQGKQAKADGGSAAVPSVGGTGSYLVFGLLLAIIAVALFLWARNRTPAAPKAPVAEGKSVPRDDLPRPDETSAPSLWRRADELAAKGQHLEALRALYGAVLAILHRRRFVRYEPTRTNGEYVDQVRLAREAPPALRGPFERLTGLFELKWYGERACDGGDFDSGRRLAEEVRGLAG